VKLLFENWRKYLLTEIQWEGEKGVMKTQLDWPTPLEPKVPNAIRDLILRYMEQHEHEWAEPDDPWYGRTQTQEFKHDRFRRILSGLALNLHPHKGDLIPGDITDGQKGEAILWLLKILKSEEDTASFDSLMKELVGGPVPDGISRPIAHALETYFHHKHLMSKNQIMQIGSLEELYSVVEEARPEIEKSRQKKIKNPNLIVEGTEFLRGEWKKNAGGEIDLDNPETVPGKGGWVIMGIHNKAASCFHGTADWCTAIPGLDYFEEYYQEDNPLFIFERRDFEDLSLLAKFQFHYGTEQFMDRYDSPVSKETFEALHGQLIKTEAYEKYQILKRYDLNKMVRIGSDASLDEIKTAIASIPKERREHWLKPLATKHFGTGPKVKTEVLRLLATKEFEDISAIAYSLTKNPATPIDVLEYLAKNAKSHAQRKQTAEELERRKWSDPGWESRHLEPAAPSPLQEYFAKFLK